LRQPLILLYLLKPKRPLALKHMPGLLDEYTNRFRHYFMLSYQLLSCIKQHE
jgi:hypothetical protein